MTIRIYILVLFLCLCVSGNLFAQPANQTTYIHELNSAATDSQKIAAYKHLITWYNRRNPDSSVWYTNSAIEYSKTHHYRLGEGLIINQLALIDEGQGRWEIAKRRYHSALELFKEVDYRPGIAEVTCDLGAIEGEQGNYPLATKLLLESLKLHEQLADSSGYMVAAMNLGSLSLQHDDTVNAAKYLFLAARIAGHIPVSDKTIALYNLVAILYATKGDMDMAFEYFKNNLKTSSKPEFVKSHVETLLYLGNFYQDAGDTKKSLENLQEGLKLAKDYSMPEMESNILLQIAVATKDKEPAAAMDYMMHAKDIAQKIDNKSFLVQVYKEIADLYRQEGKYKEALEITDKKQRLADSVFNIDKAREIASLTATYELEKSNVKVKELETLNDKNASQRNIIFFIAAGLVIALIVLSLVWRNTSILNKRLREHEYELSELNNMKDKFFSIIGHDLRSPIARIPTLLELYEDEGTDANDKEYVMNSLKEHTKASVETLDKLLFWGQALMKGIRLQEQYVYLKEYIRENIELKKLAAEDKHIEIKDNTPDDLRVYADAQHCDFIVRNLLTNAIKYTRTNGRIELSSDTNMKPGFTVFSVKDNGIGIAKEMLPTIFNPLYSIDGTANEKGTGIGLMLCKEFAIQNGGDLWVESEVGKGSTFFFSVKNAA